MPTTVKKITLWRREVENKPGTLANAIEPPAKAGADLKIVMGYRHPGAEGKATIEVYPIAGKKLTAAAQAAGLAIRPVGSVPVRGVKGEAAPKIEPVLLGNVVSAGLCPCSAPGTLSGTS